MVHNNRNGSLEQNIHILHHLAAVLRHHILAVSHQPKVKYRDRPDCPIAQFHLRNVLLLQYFQQLGRHIFMVSVIDALHLLHMTLDAPGHAVKHTCDVADFIMPPNRELFGEMPC